MAEREKALRRVALLTTGLAVAGVAGSALVAYTVSDAQAATSTSTTASTSDNSNQSSSGGVSHGGGPAHANSGGS